MVSPEQHYRHFRERGCAGALSSVFDALAPELLLVAAHLARDGGAAEDLVQATFVDAITKADRWDPTRPLLPWLLGILTNHARVRRRRSRRERGADVRSEPVSSAAPADAAESREVADAVSSGLQSVPSPMRQALALRLVHGLSPTQIAHALGCPVATVKTRLRRGLAILRRVLPRGIGSLVLAGWLGRSSLAAVREHVVVRAVAAGRALRLSAAAAVVAGAASKNVIAAVIALACCLLTLATMPWWRDELDVAKQPAAARLETAALAVADAAAAATGMSTTDTGPRTDALPRTADATGAADITFVWQGTPLPARHLQVWWSEATYGPRTLRRCFADGDGKLSLRKLPARELELHNFAFRHRWHVVAGKTVVMRIEVRPDVVVAGSVVDPDGRGIAAARVFAQAFQVGEDERPRLVAVTAADGAFVARTDRGGSFWAIADGHAPSDCREVGASNEGNAPLRLVVAPAESSLSGTVRRADGGGGAGAQLTILRCERVDTRVPPLVLVADVEGHFVTNELARGRHLVVAELDGLAPSPQILQMEPGQRQQVLLVVGKGATLSGTVRASDREPIRALLWFRLSLPEAPATGAPALDCIRQAFARMCWSDAAGRYRIEGLPPGAVAIEAASTQTARTFRTIDLYPDEQRDLDLVLVRGQSLSGRVMTMDGRPLARWNVAVSTSEPNALLSGQTDASGAFVVHGIEAASCHVQASSQGDDSGLPVHVANVALDGQDLVLRVQPMAAAGSVVGSFVLPTTAPAEGWQLLVWPRGFPLHCRQTHALRPSGRFECRSLPPGSYEFSAANGALVSERILVNVIAARALDLGPLVPTFPTERK